MADEQFRAQGARIVKDADAVFGEAELVLKFKEPQPEEVGRLRDGQTLFTYLHLAAEPDLALGIDDGLIGDTGRARVHQAAGQVGLGGRGRARR